MSRRLRIGLALAGGGARGAAHIGVLQVFHDHGISIDAVAGSSAGAVIGAMYAATLDPVWVENRYREYLNSACFRDLGLHHLKNGSNRGDSFLEQVSRFVKDRLVITLALNRKGIIERAKLEKSIEFLLPVKDFSDLKIPLSVVVTDLNAGSELAISSGDLIDAVVHSSSIPGFISPSQKDGQILVDGGVAAPIPINHLPKWAVDFTIAVDIALREVDSLGDFNLIELMTRTKLVTGVKLADELARRANFVIEPEVAGAHWSEFQRTEELLESGRRAAVSALPSLREQINLRNRWTFKLMKRFRNSA
ncbi:MAG: patatin-like phospholipase family protein [Candidatus Neomarinimicrobiota bacterium]